MQCENDSLSDVRGHDEEGMDLPKWPVGLTTLTLMSQSLSLWICVSAAVHVVVWRLY